MTIIRRGWNAGLLGLATLVAMPLSPASQPVDVVGVRIPYTIIDEYQSCVPDLPFRLPARAAPSLGDARAFVEEYFASHPKADLLSAWISTESKYDPLAVSEVGASGLGQLMPRTSRSMGLRTASVDELSCLTGLSRDSSYASLLCATREAVLSGVLPYEVASFVHEPFHMDKNLGVAFQYLRDAGFGVVADDVAFKRYHGGPNPSNWGVRTEQYPIEIRGLLQ